METIGGGNYFFHAIQLGLSQYSIVRTIQELRLLVATEMQINDCVYRPLYYIEDQQQALTYDMCFERTCIDTEWATELTVSAMARGLDMIIRVIVSGTSADGRPTVLVKNYTDGVLHFDRIITVGFNAAEQHYIAFDCVRTDGIIAMSDRRSKCDIECMTQRSVQRDLNMDVDIGVLDVQTQAGVNVAKETPGDLIHGNANCVRHISSCVDNSG